jgi:glycosyltransferase involved in cell wall biosynthesis
VRVALFTETFVPSVNGVVTRLTQSVRHLARRGDKVMVFAPGHPDCIVEGAELVPVSGFALPLYREIKVAVPRPAVGRALHRFRPDLIHVVNPAMLGLAGIYYARSLGVPLVASFHTHLPRYLHYYGLGILENVAWELLRAAHNKADLNLCISHETARDLVSHGVERVSVGWRGGVDTDRFHPDTRRPDVRAALSGGHPEAPLLLYVGRLGAEKGVERLRAPLEAIPGARLALVGDGPHRQALEQHFAGTRTHFAGSLRGSDLAAAFSSADLFVFPSQTDTLGLVLLEAMASGCPVVAAAAGGITDLVADGSTGLLFDPEQDANLVECVRRLLRQGPERAEIRANGRRLAERMSWAAATDDLRGHYAEVLKAAGAAASAA